MSELLHYKCPNCGAPLQADTKSCAYCGGAIVHANEAPDTTAPRTAPTAAFTVFNTAEPAPKTYETETKPDSTMTRRVIAGILAILFGAFGVQHFFLGKPVQGVLCVLFFWTGIPAVVSFFHGVILLCSSNASFEQKYPAKA